MYQIQHVDLAYKSASGMVNALQNISLHISLGECVAIVGVSGSGKSSFLNIVAGLEKPTKGTIYFDGKELKGPQQEIAIIFQNYGLFPWKSVKANIALPLKLAKRSKQERDRDTQLILSQLNIHDLQNRYPFQLSGGQQQRVAIARALAMSPDILCFDEPTSALDPELTGEVLNVIRSLKTGNSTMIVVTHEMEFARHVADQVLFMADGVIAESGTPEDLFNHPKSPALQAFLSKAQNK